MYVVPDRRNRGNGKERVRVRVMVNPIVILVATVGTPSRESVTD